MCNESFIQVAGRYLKDAQILFEQNRFDNTVYLATYAIESTLKLLIDNHIKAGSARHYNHSLIKLHEPTFHKLIESLSFFTMKSNSLCGGVSYYIMFSNR